MTDTNKMIAYLTEEYGDRSWAEDRLNFAQNWANELKDHLKTELDITIDIADDEEGDGPYTLLITTGNGEVLLSEYLYDFTAVQDALKFMCYGLRMKEIIR